jgi:hypothetical protein
VVKADDLVCPRSVFILLRFRLRFSLPSLCDVADLATGTSILDHDTNVFFTLPSGSSASLYQLDLNSITNAASSNAVAWEAVSSTSFQQGGQGVVMAEASNHISRSIASTKRLLSTHFRRAAY